MIESDHSSIKKCTLFSEDINISMSGLSKNLNIFFSNDTNKGSVNWLHRGSKIKSNIKDRINSYLEMKNYNLVQTPGINNTSIYIKSGHYENYIENMFQINEDLFLKPMSCPNHINIFKEMPNRDGQTIKIFEWGQVYRKEATGALKNLFRQYSFEQDDGHIFCNTESVHDEIVSILEEIEYIYRGFKIEKELMRIVVSKSTNKKANDIVEKFIQSEEFNNFSKNTKELQIHDDGGAFYAPKIDIEIEESKDKFFQLGTIQIDCETLNKFSAESDKYNVLIHRAVMGSLERFIGIYLTKFKGYFPPLYFPEKIPVFLINLTKDNKILNIEKILNSATQMYSKSNFTRVFSIHHDLDLYKYYKTSKVGYIIFIGPKELEQKIVKVNRLCLKSLKYVTDNIQFEKLDKYLKFEEIDKYLTKWE